MQVHSPVRPGFIQCLQKKMQMTLFFSSHTFGKDAILLILLFLLTMNYVLTVESPMRKIYYYF